MKKKLFIYAITAGLGIFASAKGFAQDSTSAGQDIKHAAQKTGKAVEKGAEKAGDKTAQVAASTKAVMVDKVYDGKVSPGGHRVYINKHAKYYWIDKQGHKHFITEDKLKDKS